MPRPNPPRPAKRQRKPVECWGVLDYDGSLWTAFVAKESAQQASEWSGREIIHLTASNPAPQQREVKRLRRELRIARNYIDILGEPLLTTERARASSEGIKRIDKALAPKEKRRG